MIESGYHRIVKCNTTEKSSLANIWKEVFPINEPREKSLIEISGYAGTGKRFVLYKLISRAALLERFGGKYSQVILLDLVHKFDFNIFENQIHTEISIKCSPQLSSEYAIENYCENIIHLPCYSSDQFELAFEEIENLLWEQKNIVLLAIDGIETFYWEDCRNQLQRMTTHYKKLIQRLKQLCEIHNICCVYTGDTNYLSKMNPLPTIDYRIKMLKSPDGSRFLNSLPIEINAVGIEFVTKN